VEGWSGELAPAGGEPLRGAARASSARATRRVSVPARNHSRRGGSTGGEKATCSATTPGGGSGGRAAPSASSAERIASQAGAAPETPETPRIGSPSKVPPQTPT